MRAYTKLLTIFAVVYITILFVVISAPKRELNVQDVAEFDQTKTFLSKSDDVNTDDIVQAEDELQSQQLETDEIAVESEDLSPVEVEILMEPNEVKTVKVDKNYNPFTLLGAYPDPNPYLDKIAYNTPHFGFINDDEYCNKVDQYNLEHPENMFEKMNFYSDVGKWGVVKRKVMSQIGTLLMKDHERRMPKELWNSRTVAIDKEITDFHITSYNFFKYHQIGKHYLCATQMYNHIPNHTDLVRKEYFPQRVQDYSLKYKNQPQCFDKHTLYPTTYRLFLKEECEEFFEIINSEKYKESLKTEPIQYVVKSGNDVHVAQGVFLMDREQAQSLHSQYESGKKCGQINNPMITQKYITNPMLLHNDNKFHIRVYVLIASTNPLILYYHDGYLRASAFRFDKFSEDRATHLTNLLTGTKVADALNKTNGTANGMSAKQIEDFYIWSFEQLEDYVLETGRTNDTNWLENHLRPAIQKAFVQVVRMTGSSFWNQSNVYELLGCDFMLDEDMNAWFLEANPDPLLDGVQPEMIIKMLKDLFEIEYGYYRSRMKRVLDVIKRMKEENAEDEIKDLNKWKDLYQEAVKNRLEPEYKLNETNTFKLIMDESLPGAEAYFGFLPEECVNA